MVDQETLNSSVDIESLIEDESQIVSENEIVENSERIHIHYSEHESSTGLSFYGSINFISYVLAKVEYILFQSQN